MPTPVDILTDPVSLIIIGMYLGLFLLETISPARSQPGMKNWILYGVFMFVVYFYLSSYLPMFTDKYLIRLQVLDVGNIPVVFEVLTAILLYQFGLYFWHRSMHRNNFLWRIFHQMHHSVERIDMPSAFIFSPFDMIGFTVLGSICSVLLIGLSPEATTISLLINTFIGMLQHANIKTPVWLGYIVQRPESHSIHHAKGIHAYNYSDLPVFDMIFGTFKNPRTFNEEAGFYLGASSKVGQMLVFKDISKETA